MKIFLVASFLFALVASAADMPTATVEGVVKSFDGTTVKLKNKGKTFSVPRSSILPGYKLFTGEFVRAEIPRPK